MKLGAPPLCFCDNFLRRGTPQQSFHLFCSFLQIFSLLHVSYTNISLSQSLCHKVSTQSRIVSLFYLKYFSHKVIHTRTLLWSYPPPRTECRQTFSQSLTIFLRSSVFVDVVSSMVSMRLSYLVFHCCTS